MRTPLLILVSLSTTAAHAGLMTFVGVDYNLVAQASAGPNSDSDTFQEFRSDASFSAGVLAYAEYFDGSDTNYAQGTGGGTHSFTTDGITDRIHGSVGGVAEAAAYSVDTYALGAGTLEVFFNLAGTANARMQSEGTYDSQLYRRDAGDWVQINSVNATIEDVLTAGEYRWVSSAGSDVSGWSYYSAGIEFWIDTAPVPEPASMVVLAGGLLAALRRRR